MEILAIIPARSGSKTIPHKNIRTLLGKPLIAYSIEHALSSKLINRVIVSTDSKLYAEIARKYGAEVPFLRPEEISTDESNDRDVFFQALNWLSENENYTPEICVHLRPTHPIRNSQDIDNMINMLLADSNADCIRSVVKNDAHTPYKMWFLDNDHELKPIINNTEIFEPYNQPRQKLPLSYFQNASIDVIKTDTILKKKSLSGNKILGYIMDSEFDIDNEKDFERTEQKMLELKYILKKEIKTYCFDIDGIIATLTPDNNYILAEPLISNINKINKLYEAGNKIILFTARGTVTKIDWKNVTMKQLIDWGVKYHELTFGKPAADFYIDDRNLNINEII